MNAFRLTALTEIARKLESNVLYSYFARGPARTYQGRSFSLPAMKQNLIERRYPTARDWANDVCSYFEAVLDDPDSSPVERHAARTLAQTVMAKIREIDDDRSIESWCDLWCKAYQEVAEITASAPKGLGIAKHARPMQLRGIDIEVTEAEIVQMKNDIENRLSEEQKNRVADLVLTLEPVMTMQAADEVIFDLARVRKGTLLAVRAFLRQQLTSQRTVQLFG
jgi:hypothetical protein